MLMSKNVNNYVSKDSPIDEYSPRRSRGEYSPIFTSLRRIIVLVYSLVSISLYLSCLSYEKNS